MTRRTFAALTAGLAVGAESVRSADTPVRPAQQGFVFPYSTHVYREPPLPLEQLRTDFPILKRLGFSMIKIQESWSADEVREGEVDFSRVSRVVAEARQNQLLVYFGVTMEQAPAWLWQKHPDCVMRYENNQPVIDPTQYLLPNDGKPGPCWNHPTARDAGIRFIEKLGREVGKYDNILVWNVWQEIGFGFDANASRVCFCPNTLTAYRQWLRKKFNTLSDLNSCWRTSYASWEQVDPPRVFQKVPAAIDWRYFMENVYLADALRWKAEAFRRSDPHARRILAHAPSPRYGGSEDWRMARAGLDIYGSSCYPGWSEFQDPGVSDQDRVKHSPAPYLQILDNALKWDYTRGASVNGEFWTAELQGGRASGGLTPGRVPDAGDIRRWVLGALAGGARGICFWNHRSEIFWDEAYGFGLLEMAGDSTPRAEEAGRIARAIQSKAAHLLGRGPSPPAKTAILLDEGLWNFVSCSGEPIKSGFVGALRGVHRALWQESIPVDFLDSTDLKAQGANYRALILPLPISMSDGLIEQVSNYVRKGGTLISGPFPGRFSRYGFGTPGELPRAVSLLFGVEHKQIFTLSDRAAHPSQASFKSSDVNVGELTGTNQFAGHIVDPSLYLQYLTPTSASSILEFNGEVVGTQMKSGKGQAVLIGTVFGLGVNDGQAANQSFLVAALKNAGVEPERAGKLLKRRRELDGKAAWFLFNPSRERVEETVFIGSFTTAEDLLGSTFSINSGSVRVAVEPLDILCLLLT